MNKTKVEERFKNAYESFFESEKVDENTDLEFSNENSIFRETQSFSTKPNLIWKICKQVFFILPGTFFLFLISFAFTTIATSNPFGAKLSEGSLPLIVILFFLSILMTWFGLGDLRKKEDISIPTSIVGTGVVLGVISGFISMISFEWASLIFSNNYPFYLLPIALIVPNLVKMWLDKPEENL